MNDLRYELNTSIPIMFEKIEDIPDSRFTKVSIWLCHTEDNLNGSYFSKPLIESMIPSLSNIPILGYIQEDNANKLDFAGHEERIVINKDGVDFVYLGRAYGLIPEDNDAHFEMKMCSDGREREFLVCNGLLWNKFTEAIDIFDRDNVKSQSMELESTSIQGNFEKDGLFHFTSARFEGACILGDSVIPAMHNSVIEKFSANVFNIKEQMHEMINELGISFSKEGGRAMSKSERIKTLFALSQEQLESQLKSELAEIETIVDPNWDDWSYPRYYFYDYYVEPQIVVAEDAANGYALVGFNYSLNGDFVEIDHESATPYKATLEPMTGNDPDAEDDDDITVLSSASTDYQVQVKEKEMKIIKDEFDTLKALFTALEEEAKDLREFKLSKVQSERQEAVDDLFNEFTSKGQLTEDDITDLRSNAAEMELEAIEKELFALVGKKTANTIIHNFSSNHGKHINMSIHEGNKDFSTDPYGGLVEKYINK